MIFLTPMDTRMAELKLRTVRNNFNIAVGINAQQADLEGKVVLGLKDTVIRATFS